LLWKKKKKKPTQNPKKVIELKETWGFNLYVIQHQSFPYWENVGKSFLISVCSSFSELTGGVSIFGFAD